MAKILYSTGSSNTSAVHLGPQQPSRALADVIARITHLTEAALRAVEALPAVDAAAPRITVVRPAAPAEPAAANPPVALSDADGLDFANVSNPDHFGF